MRDTTCAQSAIAWATRQEASEIADLVYAGDTQWIGAAAMLASYRGYWRDVIQEERAAMLSAYQGSYFRAIGRIFRPV